jgi:Chromo (CHRromatin Organisation MOdifier) domain
MANKRKNKQQAESADLEYYTIERIVEKRVNSVTGRLEYLCRWVGFDENDDTWECAEKLV